MKKKFSEKKAFGWLGLVLAIVAINGYNRINVALRNAPGSYQPAALAS